MGAFCHVPSFLRPRGHCAEAVLESVLGERRGQVGLLSTCKGRGGWGQALADSRGQGSLACCSPRGRRVSHDWATAQQQKLLWVTCGQGGPSQPS